MKTKMKTILAIMCAALFLTTTKINAQDQMAENKTTISFETDPSTFLFKGYAFHIRIKPKNSTHFVVGAGIYALDMPDFLVDLNPDNKNKGWNVRIDNAIGLFGEYYLKQANKKWFIGTQVGIQNFKNTNDAIPNQENKYTNLLLMPSLGYNWSPFKNGFYIKPWLGVGYTTKISGDNSTYKIAPITSFLTLHAGYTF